MILALLFLVLESSSVELNCTNAIQYLPMFICLNEQPVFNHLYRSEFRVRREGKDFGLILERQHSTVSLKEKSQKISHVRENFDLKCIQPLDSEHVNGVGDIFFAEWIDISFYDLLKQRYFSRKDVFRYLSNAIQCIMDLLPHTKDLPFHLFGPSSILVFKQNSTIFIRSIYHDIYDQDQIKEYSDLQNMAYYLPPELNLPSVSTPWTEKQFVYAFGCMIYISVTGIHPFEEPIVKGLTFTDGVAFPKFARKDIAELIVEAMQAEPSKRPSLLKMKERLMNFSFNLERPVTFDRPKFYHTVSKPLNLTFTIRSTLKLNCEDAVKLVIGFVCCAAEALDYGSDFAHFLVGNALDGCEKTFILKLMPTSSRIAQIDVEKLEILKNRDIKCMIKPIVYTTGYGFYIMVFSHPKTGNLLQKIYKTYHLVPNANYFSNVQIVSSLVNCIDEMNSAELPHGYLAPHMIFVLPNNEVTVLPDIRARGERGAYPFTERDNSKVTLENDIWSIGSHLYYMTTHKPLFTFSSPNPTDEEIDEKVVFFVPKKIDEHIFQLFKNIMCMMPSRRMSLKEIRYHLRNFNPMKVKPIETNVELSIYSGGNTIGYLSYIIIIGLLAGLVMIVYLLIYCVRKEKELIAVNSLNDRETRRKTKALYANQFPFEAQEMLPSEPSQSEVLNDKKTQ